MSTNPPAPLTRQSAEEVAERLLEATVGAFELLSVYAGDRLGWYRSLASAGPATPAELAERTGTAPRYAREWLEQQATMGLVEVGPVEVGPVEVGPVEVGLGEVAATTAGATGEDRRYSLPSGAAEALTDEASLAYAAPLGRLLAAVGPQLGDLLAAYRSGGGVSWAALGADAREAQADLNRPWFRRVLPRVLGSVPALDERLREPGAQIADLGCGAGWSTISLAEAYPQARVRGVDVDAPSIELAREHAADAGLGVERLRFDVADAVGLGGAGELDAAFAFECLHDMSRPVEVLRAVREALRPGAPMIVVDEAVADELTAPGDLTERLMYGFSLFICLPDGLSSTPSAGTGTVLRPRTLERYAQEAGFSSVEVLPIEGFSLLRFYELR